MNNLERDAGLLTRIRAIMPSSKASLMEAGSFKVKDDFIALHCRFLQSLLEQFTVSLCVSSSLSTPLLLAIGHPSSVSGPPIPDVMQTSSSSLRFNKLSQLTRFHISDGGDLNNTVLS